MLGIDAHDARRLRRPIAARKWRAERQRDFAENRARPTPAQRARDAVDQLDDFDLPRDDSEERALIALLNGEFARGKSNIGGGLGADVGRSALHREGDQ